MKSTMSEHYLHFPCGAQPGSIQRRTRQRTQSQLWHRPRSWWGDNPSGSREAHCTGSSAVAVDGKCIVPSIGGCGAGTSAARWTRRAVYTDHPIIEPGRRLQLSEFPRSSRVCSVLCVLDTNRAIERVLQHLAGSSSVHGPSCTDAKLCCTSAASSAKASNKYTLLERAPPLLPILSSSSLFVVAWVLFVFVRRLFPIPGDSLVDSCSTVSPGG